jgi:hypothetical protein
VETKEDRPQQLQDEPTEQGYIISDCGSDIQIEDAEEIEQKEAANTYQGKQGDFKAEQQSANEDYQMSVFNQF